MLLCFNGLVISLDRLLEARYAIAIAGMLLGNSLGGAIIGIGDFYKSIKRDDKRYQYMLAAGATRFEALASYIRSGITRALKPVLANMATMGLVFLPGMMTGQILSVEDPLLAVKYQIAIVIAIFVCITITVALSVLLTVKMSFDEYGILRKDIFR
jgi:putative ABC transport system permease protein